MYKQIILLAFSVSFLFGQTTDSLSISNSSNDIDSVPLILPVDSTKKTDTLSLDSLSPTMTDSVAFIDSTMSKNDSTMNGSVTNIGNSQSLLNSSDQDSVYLADSSRFSIYLQAGIQFVDFDDRDRFFSEVQQTKTFMKMENSFGDEITIREQDTFEPVNFTIPLYIGFSSKITHNISLSTGIGYFFHTREIAILSEDEDEGKTFEYSLKAVPLFLEYRHKFSESLISIKEVRNFNFSFRWFWFLEQTEIRSTNRPIGLAKEKIRSLESTESQYTYTDIDNLNHEKILKSKFNPWGNGGGIYLGYEFNQWKSISLEGDIGVNIVKIQGTNPWSSILPLSQTPSDSEKEAANFKEENATWNFGGLTIQIKFAYYFGSMEPPSDENKKTLQSGSGGRNSYKNKRNYY